MEGRLIKVDNIEYGIGNIVNFVNNKSLRYSAVLLIWLMKNTSNHAWKNGYIATTIIGLARYSDNYSRSAGPSIMFTKDTNDHPENRNATTN